jgi:hypothetical protein
MARPSFKPTAIQRRKVSIAAGAGMSHESIATVLGISRNTLEKHFERELSVGAYERRFEAVQGLHAAAKRGNVSACKAYLAGTPQFVPPPAEGAKPVAQPSAPSPAPVAQPLGKKEAAQAAAKTAQQGTGWDGILPGASPLQ